MTEISQGIHIIQSEAKQINIYFYLILQVKKSLKFFGCDTSLILGEICFVLFFCHSGLQPRTKSIQFDNYNNNNSKWS